MVAGNLLVALENSVAYLQEAERVAHPASRALEAHLVRLDHSVRQKVGTEEMAYRGRQVLRGTSASG